MHTNEEEVLLSSITVPCTFIRKMTLMNISITFMI